MLERLWAGLHKDWFTDDAMWPYSFSGSKLFFRETQEVAGRSRNVLDMPEKKFLQLNQVLIHTLGQAELQIQLPRALRW